MIETDVGTLTVPELGVLVELNLKLADCYQAIADHPDAEAETRRTAQALAAWRRGRARYFREEGALTEREEAAYERAHLPAAAKPAHRAGSIPF
jgi:phage-related minor tail protein